MRNEKIAIHKKCLLWLDTHKNEFRKLKEMLTSDLLVKTFDPKLPTMLLTDESRLNGLGHALLQKENDNKTSPNYMWFLFPVRNSK